MARTADTRLPISTETRERLRTQKRGGESYDDLLQKMIDQYDPESAQKASGAAEATNTAG
jgi:hypothetical protein